MNAVTAPVCPTGHRGLPSKTALHLALCDNTIDDPLCRAVHALTARNSMYRPGSRDEGVVISGSLR
ncbi:hypothetical protein [Nocardia sp. CDC160]|uniref:hypothetical protein n=1 Tax=Nocardia sp. CDC160 TaxID=3112166 RepID=UPI002DBE3A8C|nr:hypothetical protein [Nocardia sp. CDC160]MEC3920276.1 hypothetical protein [Nocardia sp. CDC160]